jgi:dTMP kinase
VNGQARWVSVEGVNGVGKTYLTRRLAEQLGPECVRVAEVTDQAGDRLPGRVIDVLSSAGDTFLRTGHPLTETFALLALKVREYEHLQATTGTRAAGPGLVVEDRGVDTVAVYQAVILGGDAPLEELCALARRIQAAVGRWRPPPDHSVLLLDDLEVCLGRMQARLGRRLSPGERTLVARVEQLYQRLAASEPRRWWVVDRRGRDEEQTLNSIAAACTSGLGVGGAACGM